MQHFDEAEQGVSEVDGELEDYLDQVRSRMKCKRGIIYVSLNKDSHVLELPEVLPCKLPIFEIVELASRDSKLRSVSDIAVLRFVSIESGPTLVCSQIGEAQQ
jgi:hypothetical protein